MDTGLFRYNFLLPNNYFLLLGYAILLTAIDEYSFHSHEK